MQSIQQLLFLFPVGVFAGCDEPTDARAESADALESRYNALLEELSVEIEATPLRGAATLHMGLPPSEPQEAGWLTLAEGEYENAQLLYADQCGTVQLGQSAGTQTPPGGITSHLLITESSADGFDLGTTLAGTASPLTDPVGCRSFGLGFVCDPTENIIDGTLPFWPGGPYDAVLTQRTSRAGRMIDSDEFVVLTKAENICEGVECDDFLATVIGLTSPEAMIAFDCSPQYVLSRESFVQPLAESPTDAVDTSQHLAFMASAQRAPQTPGGGVLGAIPDSQASLGDCSSSDWPESFYRSDAWPESFDRSDEAAVSLRVTHIPSLQIPGIAIRIAPDRGENACMATCRSCDGSPDYEVFGTTTSYRVETCSCE